MFFLLLKKTVSQIVLPCFLAKIIWGYMKKFLFLVVCITFQAVLMSSTKILIKIPTRERPEVFFSCLDKYVSFLSGENDVLFLVSCDNDDVTMNNPVVIERLKLYPNLIVYFAERTNKVGAINRDIEKHSNFDILVSGSDDMIPVQEDYDKIIVKAMLDHFPDFDGVLNFSDGFLGSELNTLPIIGKKYFERFGYIYYPEYQSIACDIELTLVSKMLLKEACLDTVIIKHFHPTYGYAADPLLVYNESREFYLHDRALLYKRKAANFDLMTKDIVWNQLPTSLDMFGKANHSQVKWSILICTLDARKKVFCELYNKLLNQILDNNLQHEVEIVFFKDNRENSIGYKRNSLLMNAKGEYLCFIDDDDDVSKDYINLLYQALVDKPDCVSLCGILLQEKSRHCKFYHSIKYRKFANKGRLYLRPPNHLNLIKSSIAKQFRFPDISFGEDSDWSMQICNSGLLVKENKIDRPYYYYKYDAKKTIDDIKD